MSLLFQLLIALALLGICIGASVFQTRGVSVSDKQVILDAHNSYRRGVSPTATNMRKMYWNDDLETAAQTWVDKCIAGHDDSYARRKSVNIGARVAQNFAQALSWAESIKQWYDEVRFFNFESQATNKSGEAVDDYMQVVWSESSLVGCAMADCGTQKNYICNYAYGHVAQHNLVTYKSGPSCADCPLKCDNQLCDCPNGKICKNGGQMNLNDCSCECRHGFKGDSCEICPFIDESSTCSDPYWQTLCATLMFVPAICPVMCGFCPDNCPGKDITLCEWDETMQKDCTCGKKTKLF